MAKESGNDEPAEELREEIARSRESWTRDLRGLRTKLDFPRKIRRSFQTQTSSHGWPRAASGRSSSYSGFTRRKKKVYVTKKRGEIERKTSSKLGSCLAF